MVGALITSDIVEAGLLSCAIGGGVGAGQFLGSLLASPGGHIRWKLIFSVVAFTAFSAGLAGAKIRGTASALATLASVFIGALESLAVTMVTIVIPDQSELGAAGGAFGSIRSMGGVLATDLEQAAILSTVLTNKVTSNTKAIVVPALVKAGLPLTSIEPLFTALSSGNSGAIAAMPGVTQSITAVAVAGIKLAYSKAFTAVYLVTLAF
ncbi:hypothetical protein LTR10_024253 [Elasticomyces elasticus]|uniref:Major facilitator superfamily (MFS) profile domain-containing protein n=1 Tax=Exophiala sideris TaxID=1016849 RepID=A0ABR0IU98_9EURO|nr:hypothetical protein LTR10_024253 [Elasticomyces elasticus]KAK5020851.1 hypothetical protein LTS07_011402 [Exophiala sideris]KAK5048390.1 hypothetical protein LTR69_011416 [Exophiala sideris]KAK5176018.1 hypothetical protein LTR44_011425 [Eurotiomycetes sp. CCFEE 6388]